MIALVQWWWWPSDIESRAALDIKFFAIPETIYSQQEDEFRNLYDYVEKQMKSAKDVVTIKQFEARREIEQGGTREHDEEGDGWQRQLKELNGDRNGGGGERQATVGQGGASSQRSRETHGMRFSTVWRMQG